MKRVLLSAILAIGVFGVSQASWIQYDNLGWGYHNSVTSSGELRNMSGPNNGNLETYSTTAGGAGALRVRQSATQVGGYGAQFDAFCITPNQYLGTGVNGNPWEVSVSVYAVAANGAGTDARLDKISRMVYNAWGLGLSSNDAAAGFQLAMWEAVNYVAFNNNLATGGAFSSSINTGNIRSWFDYFRGVGQNTTLVGNMVMFWPDPITDRGQILVTAGGGGNGGNTPVPEPFTMGLGIAAAAAFARRRIKAQKLA
ncbi:MAG: hypothetical protein IT203_11585 [Fimbriimonadaceae bacterium]|nr:hypothetical protein [Fimbriimonadaceae bacterium]